MKYIVVIILLFVNFSLDFLDELILSIHTDLPIDNKINMYLI